MGDNTKRGQAAANAIRMKRDHGSDQVYLLVEGMQDASFYAKFMNKDFARPEVCHGRPYVLEAFRLLDQEGERKVLAAIDFDGDDDVPFSMKHTSVICTELNDIEMTAAMSSAFPTTLLKHRLSHEDADELRANIIAAAAQIGALRSLSKEHNWRLRFRDLDKSEFSTFTKTQGAIGNITIDRDKLLAMIMERTGIIFNGDRKKVETLWSMPMQKKPLDLCHGHDFAKIASVFLTKRLKENIRPDEFESILLANYDSSDFATSQMCKSIQSWEEDTGIRVLKAHL